MIDLLSIWLIVWLIKTAAEDVSYAIKGAPNPRYELRRQKAIAAGKRAPARPRYGSRDWFADLVSDGLAAQTERRRAKAAEKAQAAVEARAREERPLDDLAEAVREEPQQPVVARVTADEFPEFERGAEPEWLTPDPDEHLIGPRPVCRRCGRGQIISVRADGDEMCNACGWKNPNLACPYCEGGRVHPTASGNRQCNSCGRTYPTVRFVAPVDESPTGDSADEDTRPDAVIIPFPTNIEKEISMATSEVNGLTTALAFATAAADAHASFATGGSEGYTGALAGWEVGDRCVGLAREAQEASQIAAAKWQAHVESLEEQLKVKEAYQGAPDAGNKTFLLNG